MASKTDTEVIIGGRVFTLCGYESEEYLQKVASYINNKLVEYTAESPVCGPKAPILQHRNMHIKFNYRETDAYNRIGVPSETVLGKSKRRCSRGVRGAGAGRR